MTSIEMPIGHGEVASRSDEKRVEELVKALSQVVAGYNTADALGASVSLLLYVIVSGSQNETVAKTMAISIAANLPVGVEPAWQHYRRPAGTPPKKVILP